MNIIVKIVVKILNLWFLVTKPRGVRFVTVRASLKRCLPAALSAGEMRQMVPKRFNHRHPPHHAVDALLPAVRDAAAPD
jgi:hypothetical protein